jgi:hypothetical protein
MFKTRLFAMAAVIAMPAFAACSSSSVDDNSGNDNRSCTVKLTGAIVSTSSCNATADFGLTMVGVSELAILNNATPGFTLGIYKTGQLTAGTITESSSGVTLAITTANNGSLSNGGLLWSQSTEDPVHGSITVKLTSVSLGSDGYTYTIHGTADGTLTASPATPNAAGTVTVHVDF